MACLQEFQRTSSEQQLGTLAFWVRKICGLSQKAGNTDCNHNLKKGARDEAGKQNSETFICFLKAGRNGN